MRLCGSVRRMFPSCVMIRGSKGDANRRLAYDLAAKPSPRDPSGCHQELAIAPELLLCF
jgi:hypothetical protein